MFQGQPKSPIYKKGDLVYAFPKPDSPSSIQSSGSNPSPSQNPFVPPKPNSSAVPSHTVPTGLTLSPTTRYRVVGVAPSTTDTAAHTYILELADPGDRVFTAEQEQLIRAAPFTVGAVVKFKSQRLGRWTGCRQVKELWFSEEGKVMVKVADEGDVASREGVQVDELVLASEGERRDFIDILEFLKGQ